MAGEPTKNYQTGGQNHSKISPKRPLGGVLGGVLEGSWGVFWELLGGLGTSWGGLGGVLAPRWPQEPKMLQNPNVGFPYWGPCWGPKSIKIGPKSDLKSYYFFDNFLDRLLERFGANLAPTWLPKPSQNGAKLAPKSMQVGLSIFKLFLKGSWH